MRRLEPQTLQDFIDIERPSGAIDGAYARVVATLRSDPRYPIQMQQLAERIANDGMVHERHFLDMRAVLRRMHDESSYLRELKRAAPQDQVIGLAMGHFRDIKRELEIAFRSGAGVGWHEHHHDLFHGTERFFRPNYNANLITAWIPALDGVRSTTVPDMLSVIVTPPVEAP